MARPRKMTDTFIRVALATRAIVPTRGRRIRMRLLTTILGLMLAVLLLALLSMGAASGVVRSSPATPCDALASCR